MDHGIMAILDASFDFSNRHTHMAKANIIYANFFSHEYVMK